jgi:hypothetical protein
MVNVSHPELKETAVRPLPDADLNTLKRMREDACAVSSSYDFNLQPQQRFLRRVLSPDSPTQSLLMAHGVGSGKTCTAIQVAEEYIIRPEFQDKRVLVLANPSIQENFRNQIFDISRVNVDPDGLVQSKQCTGRRYLDAIQRAMPDAFKMADATGREKVRNTASRILKEFYEFQGYGEFGNILERQRVNEKMTPKDIDAWIRDTFSNRLIIVDEAHNLRETSETETSAKIVSEALKKVIQVAEGITLVLLTATPMYDKFNEILDYFNLFLWNERKQERGTSILSSDLFTETGDFVTPAAQTRFRDLCDTYVSYIRGENPFTFPFRLDPPLSMIAAPDRTVDVYGRPLAFQRKYLTLCAAPMSDYQESVVSSLTPKGLTEHRTVCVMPENKDISDVFKREEGQFTYTSEPFLAPSKVATYSAKFASILKCIKEGKGVVFVYSNMVEYGAQLFAMCLEEHGFRPAFGQTLLAETSGETPAGSTGRYALFTSDTSDADIKRTLGRLRRRENMNGQDVRVIVASPKVSEGVDFRYVRQIHILDPWFNMSRIEQVIGRGTRTCSHSLLDFEDQNCTVYLHVCRGKDGKEMLDEYIYREIVEQKAIKIAKVKRSVMEAAMDCSLELPVNSLPEAWKALTIHQVRSQNQESVNIKLGDATAPTFLDDDSFQCAPKKVETDPSHVRPLSSILDVKDEIFDKLVSLFAEKSVWKQNDLATVLTPYDASLTKYIIQSAIDSELAVKDSNGRVGRLESKKGLVAFAIGENDTLQDRIVARGEPTQIALKKPDAPPVVEEDEAVVEAKAEDVPEPALNIDDFKWPGYAQTFSYEAKVWYYLDHEMEPDARIKHLLSLNWAGDLPAYAAPLKVNDSLAVFGSKKIYNLQTKQEIEPVGGELTAYKAWIESLKTRYISTRDKYFATMEGKTILFNLDEKSKDELKRAERSKNIGGRKCTNFDLTVLRLFAKWLGSEFPASVKVKPDRCMYLDLLIRQVVLDKRDGIVWWTPEEWSVMNEDQNRKDLLKRLK